MTTELEQEFYDTFGIEPEYYCTYEKVAENKLEYECTDNNLEKCKECKEVGERYSEITAEKLLEMICILNKHYAENFQCATMLVGDTIEKIKECILKDCIEQSQHIKSNIQQLFKD